MLPKYEQIRGTNLRSCAVIAVAFFIASSASLSANGQGVKPSTHVASEAAAAAQATPTTNGSAPGQPTAPTAQTTAKIIALPTPFPPGLIQGIVAQSQAQAIRNHLSEVIRYYRMAVTQVQKVGEPSDILYAQQVQSEATQAGQLAFKAARGQADFMARIPSNDSKSQGNTAEEVSKVSSRILIVSKKLADLQAQQSALDLQIKTAPSTQRGALADQQGDVEGQLKLYGAILSALQKIVTSSTGQASGLQGDIDRLQHSVPELVDGNYKPVAGTIDSMGSGRDAGVTTQATMLFQFLSTEHDIDARIQEISLLHSQAEALREPLTKVLSGTLAATQTIEQDTSSSANDLKHKSKMYEDLTNAFTALSDVAVPLTQEVLVLERAQATLVTWRSSVDIEKKSILHTLLLRVVGILFGLAIIFAIGIVWRRAVVRYVQDVRRRRQLLLIRRLVIGGLSGLVLILGFVTQFNSLATFAGFITAGIAVGLQTILLSVAAYFFVVGRYGIRVGDRITVAGVTGEVLEVGLVRFYMLELTGSGTEFHPTGRVAVFANSVLFQTGTPLYKQLPGSDFAWHELTLKVRPGLEYRPTLVAVRNIVESVYAGYKETIEKQHSAIESWIDTAIETPRVEDRLELSDGMQYVVLYPVQIENAAETDEALIEEVMKFLSKDSDISKVVDGTPTVRAVVKS